MTMENRYQRNRLYVSEEEQARMKHTPILISGAGVGSIIAECALRFGFESLTIVDGDIVEESNLNRQNYTTDDLGRPKAEALCKRLSKINPNAKIEYINNFVNKKNVASIIAKHEIAINALDFKDETPFVFDEICAERGIPVLHPYNFGWAGFLTIVKPDGHRLTELSCVPNAFELQVAKYAASYGRFWHMPITWLSDIIEQYESETSILPPPQLSIASWIVAGHCVNAMFNIVTGRPIKYFPQFYFSSLICEKDSMY